MNIKKFQVNEKFQHEDKIFENIKYNSKLLFKYVKSKTKIPENVRKVKMIKQWN